ARALPKNTGPGQNAIALKLEGTKSNRSAIGARVTIEASGRSQIADVVSGGSYYSQSAFTLYFGVAQAERIDRVEVRWPRGEKQSWRNLGVNRTLLLTEGK